MARRDTTLIAQGEYRHKTCEDISPAEIERRYRAALRLIQLRSLQRRMEAEPIRLGRQQSAEV